MLPRWLRRIIRLMSTDTQEPAGEADRPVANDHSLDTQRYQASVDHLRARGCRCPLRYDTTQQMAVPLSAADAAFCRVHAGD